ncbi:MAG: CPBP family intramembrane metalloprotease [Chloroflexi bacterium]|nr:CPBP family intramembrane metalloprotease [Chloroflexota bacterium]
MGQTEQLLFPPAGEPAPAQPGTPWGPGDIAKAVAAIVGIAVVTFGIVLLVAAALTGDEPTDGDQFWVNLSLGISIGLEVVLLGAAVGFSVGKYKCSWGDLGLRWPRRGGLWFPLAVLVSALLIVYVYIFVLVAAGIEPASSVPDATFDNLAAVIVLGVLSLGFAPFIEEVFFRGFVFGGLRGRWGFFWAALASASLFAVAHVDPLVYIPFAGVGLLFAWAYAYSGSLLTTMIAHFAFNGISLIFAIAGVGS